jgi:hypothetical protein
MKDGLIRPRMRRMNPNSRDAADGVGFKGHVHALGNAFQEGIERLTCCYAPKLAFLGLRHGAHGGDGRCILRVERV